MIVDLLRNDITKAQSGTIDVPELFSIEKYDFFPNDQYSVWPITR